MSADRTLRILTLLTSALAVPLLIGSSIASLKARGSWHHRNLTEFCVAFIPLGLTAAASIVGIRRRGREPGIKVSCLDLAAAVTYLAILIPIWVVDIGYSSAPGMGLLVGYTTALMIVNM
jgi:peptidoglycan/LPS O-acetylase OafA/YrhL